MNRAFQRPLVEQLRRRCLAYPEVTETSSWDHPNFRAGRKTFCTFEIIGSRPSIAFRLSPTEVDALLRKKNFFATPYGRNQWASVWVDGPVKWIEVERLLDRSYRLVANKRMLAALDTEG